MTKLSSTVLGFALAGVLGAAVAVLAMNIGSSETTDIVRDDARGTAEVEQLAALVDRLTDRIEVMLSDYRDLEGTYDKLVSIEMIEAVGHEFLDDYFAACSRRLRPGGRMMLQAITMPDLGYDQYLRSVDFIQRYVFPGSCLPSLGSIVASTARATDLSISRVEDIGPHYAETLRHWRRAFFAKLDEVRALGYPERFVRLWDFYLTYCEAGFEEGVIGDLQVVLTKPGAGAAS